MFLYITLKYCKELKRIYMKVDSLVRFFIVSSVEQLLFLIPWIEGVGSCWYPERVPWVVPTLPFPFTQKLKVQNSEQAILLTTT